MLSMWLMHSPERRLAVCSIPKIPWNRGKMWNAYWIHFNYCAHRGWDLLYGTAPWICLLVRLEKVQFVTQNGIWTFYVLGCAIWTDSAVDCAAKDVFCIFRQAFLAQRLAWVPMKLRRSWCKSSNQNGIKRGKGAVAVTSIAKNQPLFPHWLSTGVWYMMRDKADWTFVNRLGSKKSKQWHFCYTDFMEPIRRFRAYALYQMEP